jgi:hypothetical protein
MAAPDLTRALVFSHGWEMTMMNWTYRLTLLDHDFNAIEGFTPADAAKISCAWSDDSALFAIFAGAPGYALWLGDTRGKRFALIPVSYPQFLYEFRGATHVLLRHDPEQYKAINSNAVAGGGETQYPVRRYKACADTLIDAAALAWHTDTSPENLAAIMQGLPLTDTGFTEDGLHPYGGKFPASTVDVLNERPLEVFHLELFAAYGDRQAQEWLAQVRQKAPKDPGQWGMVKYSRVKKYLGNVKRTIPPGV